MSVSTDPRYANDELRFQAVRAAILADPRASNREIGRRTHTSHPYVRKVRDLVEDEDVGAPRWRPDLTAFERLEADLADCRRHNAQLLADNVALVRRVRELEGR